MILFIGNNMPAIISGDLTISDGVTLTVNSDLNGPNPGADLGCKKEGGTLNLGGSGGMLPQENL